MRTGIPRGTVGDRQYPAVGGGGGGGDFASYRRRRNPGFAREMHLSLEMGYTRIEAGLLESFEVEAHEHDAWRHNEPPPPVPPALDQVTGWSHADADKTPQDPTRALFGGWRFEDVERRRGG